MNKITKKIKNIVAWCWATLPRRIVSCLVIAGLILTSAWYLFLKPQPVEASWWDEDWMYRRAVPIDTHTSEETDVYIEITNIDTSDTDKFQTDCGDIRFTKLDGTVLDYYIVSGCGTASTTIHVYYDTFPAGAQTIYLYYGNPSIDNGYEGTDFTTQATSYSLGSIGSEEKGTGPVLWLKFDEGYGNTAYDSSSQGNHGTITDASWTDFGKFNKALNFDGSGDYVQVADDGSLDFGTSVDFSITAWIRSHGGVGDDQTVVGKGDTGVDPRILMKVRDYDDDAIFFTIGGGGTNCDGSTDILDGAWHFIAMSVDRDGSFLGYVDGIQDCSAGATDGINVTNAVTLNVGRSWSGAEARRYFNGIIDEVKIYPYARTEAQIKRDYNYGAAARIGRDDSWITDGLVGHWKMDEDSWDTTPNQVIDSSGAGNHGTSADNATTTGTAKFGRAGTFDGSGDYVDCGNPDLSSMATSGTVTAWAYVKSGGDSYKGIVSKSAGTETGEYFLDLYYKEFETDTFQFTIGNQTDNQYVVGSVGAKDTWYFVAGYWNATEVCISVNGTDQNCVSLTYPFYDSIDTLKIGRAFNGSNYEYKGLIDDVRVYNRALDEFELRRLYEWGPSPIAHWTMDEGSGSSVYDSSENENTGTLQGGTTWKGAADCKYGNCLEFDGANDYVEVLANSSLEGFSAFTLMAWVSPTGDHGGNYGRIISKTQGASNDDYALSQRSDTDQFVFRVNTDVDRTTMWSDTAAVPNSGWWHVAATWNTDGDMEIFVNGFSDGTNSQTGTLDDSNEHMGIGGHPDSATRRFNGMIDDVKIYNYVRTQKQIYEDMLGSRPVVTERTGSGGSTVGYWKLDEGSGTTANDSSGRNNDLTLSAESWTGAGKFGRAWDGDGAKWLYITDDDDFDFTATQDFSATMWFKSDSATNPSGNEFLLSKYSEAGYGIYANKDGNIVFGIDDDATWTPDDRAGPGVNKDFYDNTWHHVSVVKVATSSIETFIDGKSIGKDSSLSATGTLDNSASLYIGDKDGSDNGDEFSGDIDEVKIYRFALSPEDILLDYNKGKSVMMGAIGTESDGTTPSWSQDRAYCPPGFTGTCDPPVGEWKMDERTDDTCAGGTNDVCDTSSNTNDGAINGNPVWKGEADCKYASCLSFDGTNDYVGIGDQDIFSFADAGSDKPFSISAWVYYIGGGGDGGTAPILTKYYDTSPFDGEWDCTIWPEGALNGGTDQFQCQVVDDSALVRLRIESQDSIPTRTWTHVAMTYDGSGVDTGLELYINGSLAAVDRVTQGSYVKMTPDIADVEIGSVLRNEGAYNSYFNGQIDDVMIFDYEMTQEQISWLYNKGKPVGHWKFDEGEGDTAYDSSGNDNSGSLEDNTSWTTSGKFNSALTFDGNGDYVLSSAPVTAAPLTICAWVKLDQLPSDFGDEMTIVSIATELGGTTYHWFNFRADDATDKVQVGVRAGASTCDAGFSTATVTAGVWEHYCGVYVSSSSRFAYLNGNLGDTEGTDNCTPTVTQTTIGALNWGSSTFRDYTKGLIDEVKIYNYALTAEQIKIDYNQGAALRFGD